MEYRKQMERLAGILFGRLENEKTYSGDIAPISEQLHRVLNDTYSEAYTEIQEAATIEKNLNQRIAEVEELKAALNFRGIDSSIPVTITPPPDLCDFCTKEKNDGVCLKCTGVRKLNVNLNPIACYTDGCKSLARFAFNETLENGEQGNYLKYCTKHTQEHLRQEVLEEAARNTPNQADNPEKYCICEDGISLIKPGVCDYCLLPMYCPV